MSDNIVQALDRATVWSRGNGPSADNGDLGGYSASDILPFSWFDGVEPATDVADFVEGLLTDGAMSVVYGESNTGRTFVASDIAMRTALGWSWQDREIEPGGVLYLAAEGGHGIRNRIAAFRHHHGVEGSPPFAVVPASVNLRDAESDTDRIIRTANAMHQATGSRVRLVVVDTLARALAGGEENSSQDMGAVVQAVDRIRQETGAHVMLIHHSGKDTAKGARGHSSLRAATDTEIEVSRPEGVETGTVTVKKQRDLPMEGLFSFKLRSVPLGTDRRGNSVTSCVVEPADDGAPTMSSGPRLTANQSTMLDILREAGAAGLTVEEWNTRAREAGLGTRRKADLRDYRAALSKKGLAHESQNGRWHITNV